MAKKTKDYSVSVIIPCYNEEKNIKECVSRTPKLGSKTEIIVVDDGSSDKTAEIARKLQKKYKDLRVISYRPNKGKGNAVRTGFNAAKGDILMILDADMAVRPEDLPKFVKPLIEGKAEFANGTRFVYKMQSGAMKGLNNFGNRVMAFLFTLVLRKRLTDTLCGTKVLFRKDFEKMKIYEDDPWGDFSLIFGAARNKLKIVEVPVKYHRRVAGKSKMNFFVDSAKLLKLWTRLFLQYIKPQ